ncbi:MAG: glycosyltransferase [Verrucomicrobia bacterium]|nr:glycosyltransferase [Verrucomicrobiota bacterium]
MPLQIPFPAARANAKKPRVLLTVILAALALLSFALNLWQWIVAARFPLHRRVPGDGHAPPVTLLKPLKGCDAETAACLRSWFQQNYAGPVQILFGVATAEDPVCEVVRHIIAENPRRDAQLVVCSESLGPNAKVSTLAQLERLARHEVILVSDADVWAPPDTIASLVVPLDSTPTGRSSRREEALASNLQSAICNPQWPEPPHVGGYDAGGNCGLACCFYKLDQPANLAMRWEALAVNADFWAQVLQSQSLQPLDFALGAVMATTRRHLAALGGFASLADYLADDYQLGHQIAAQGGRIVLCPLVVECRAAPMTWGAVFAHQLRWARTIRVCRPAPYFFSILSNATFWPLLWVACFPSLASGVAAGVGLAARLWAARYCEEKLCGADAARCWPLAPLKDLLQVVIWALAFAGNQVTWRGQKFRVTPGGKLVEVPVALAVEKKTGG